MSMRAKVLLLAIERKMGGSRLKKFSPPVSSDSAENKFHLAQEGKEDILESVCVRTHSFLCLFSLFFFSLVG